MVGIVITRIHFCNNTPSRSHTSECADVPSRYPQDSKVDITGARLDEERITASNVKYLESHCTGKYKPIEGIKVPPNVESLSDRWSNSRIW